MSELCKYCGLDLYCCTKEREKRQKVETNRDELLVIAEGFTRHFPGKLAINNVVERAKDLKEKEE